MLRKLSAFSLVTLLVSVVSLYAAPPDSPADWHATVRNEMPLLGHRNWILVVDSAYPLQSAPGIETIETNGGMTDVLRYVLGTINHSEHVRPDITLDAELPYVSEDDAPGVSRYRDEIKDLLRPYRVTSTPHINMLNNLPELSKSFHILVLKTHMTIPYTSVFIQLNCRYWSDEAESRLRDRMQSAPNP
jgi:hypothetical protein